MPRLAKSKASQRWTGQCHHYTSPAILCDLRVGMIYSITPMSDNGPAAPPQSRPNTGKSRWHMGIYQLQYHSHLRPGGPYWVG